jgi:putative glutamine amidotransferase
MSRRPLIGITTYGRDEANHFTLPAQYVEAVERAGGVPVLVAPTGIRPEEWLQILDGIILAGGGDIGPELYGGAPHEAVYMVDVERDRSELSLAGAVATSRLPTLGICRGTQLLGVAMGGSLLSHIPDVIGEKILHRLPPREPTEHEVAVDADSGLAGLLGKTRFSAASWHHQALDRVPADFRVVAHAPDGVIEAIEMPSHPWLYGVQWHPELTAHRDVEQQQLFDALVQASTVSRETDG